MKHNIQKYSEEKKIKLLHKFNEYIKRRYEEGKIKAPIHLHGCNNECQEKELVKIFKNITDKDWIFSTWRSHWHWILSGRHLGKLKSIITSGNSMHVFGDNFFTSAIVGGIAPIAIGVAWSLKKKRSKSHVYCFLGDMGATTGIAMESIRYACGHELPITFIVEDNGLSVSSDSREIWGCKNCEKGDSCLFGNKKITRYVYSRKYPHAGTGKFIMF